MHKNFQDWLRQISFKEFFDSMGMGETYDFLRRNIVMNDRTFMVVCALLFIAIYFGVKSDSGLIKYGCIFLFLFLMFFRLTILV